MAHQAKSVLWVDDEPELLEPHRMFLRDKGFHVETASNADDAAEMVRRRTFDLVLLDEQMPGKRGLEAYRELREIDPNVRKPLYAEVQRILAKDMPYIDLWYLDNVLVHTRRVSNLKLNPAGNYDFLRTAEQAP